jgi:ABC-2 type transport system permease protein
MARPDDSVIHDIGYRRYEGERLGRGHGVRALYVASLRAAFGLGRSAKAKVLPFGILALLCGLAAVFAVIRQVTGETVLTYLDFPSTLGLLLLIFLAVVAPELVSRDLRNKTLPLYFSRPMSRLDYAVAKLAAMVTAVFVVLAAPLLVMFLGAVLSIDGGLRAVWNEWQDFAPGVLNAALYAVVLSALALVVASATGRRAFAAGGVVAVFLVTTPVAGVISAIGTGALQDLGGVFSPLTLLSGAQRWIFGGDDWTGSGRYGAVYALVTLALTAATVGLFIRRYQKVAA